MIIGNNQANESQMDQSSLTLKDLMMGERIKKVTTHDLFELTHNNQIFVAKLFKPQFHHNYQLELNILRYLHHPNIVSLMYHQTGDPHSTGYSRSDMLIFKWAQHGSLNQYIPLNGRLPESIARVIFLQMISALKYASTIQPNGIIHPNLLPSNILLDSERQVKICGWSSECEKKEKKDLIKQLLFNCCEALILMLTGYMPFFKKDPKCDPLYRYVRPQLMTKFWQIFQKRIVSKHKSFSFSPEVKQLIEKVFLGQWTTFQQVQSSAWTKLSPVTNQEYSDFLSQRELNSRSKRDVILKKQHQRSEERRRILIEYEEETLHGGSSRSSGQYDFFIQDYYDNCCHKHDVPASQCSELIQLYDNRPNFVIASLKQHLRHLQDSDIDWIFGGQFGMQSYDFFKEENQVYLRFIFVQVNEDLIDREQDVEITVKSIIRFFKNSKDHLFAEVKVLESSLSQFYASQIMRFIEDKIKEHQP